MDKIKEQMYGYGTGDHIVLIGSLPTDLRSLDEVLLGYSCYPPSLPKIHNELEMNGRYECVVQVSWFRNQYANLKRHLAEVGIELQVISMTTLSRQPLQLNDSNKLRSELPRILIDKYL
jgi:hypothetical protein